MNERRTLSLTRFVRGFTLVEVSVVVLIVALIITSMTVKLDSWLPATRAESAARQLLSVMDLARTSAISSGDTYWLEMDFEENRFRILTPWDIEGLPANSPEERVGLPWYLLPDGVHFANLVRSNGERFQKGRQEVPFDPLGGSEEVWIQLENEAGESYSKTARITALTGQAIVDNGLTEPLALTEGDF